LEIRSSGKCGRNLPLCCQRRCPIAQAEMTSDAPPPAKPLFVTVGENPARPFGMDPVVRANALSVKAGLEPAHDHQPGRSTLYADLNWAWDPEWLIALAKTVGGVL